MWLLPAINAFSRQPGARPIHVVPTEREVDLVADGIDVALRISIKLTSSSLLARRLSGIEFALYASPRYLVERGTPATVVELAAHDWVDLAKPGIPPTLRAVGRVRTSTDDLVFAAAAIKQGFGVGLLPKFVGADAVARGQLVQVVPSWSWEPCSLFLVHAFKPQAPAKVTAFRDFILRYLVEHPLTSASIPGRFIDEKGNGKTASRESGRRRQHRGVAATSAVERLRPQTR
jgi:DNA-binding transcriptional LysR family regulator